MVNGLFLLVVMSCVLDRTGQSATEAYKRQMALQGTRTEALQESVREAMRRVDQLEEVTRARGQEEIYRMENLDQLRNEVASLRGDLEVLQHEIGLDVEFSGRFQEDADYRLTWLEKRTTALEDSLGLETPEPPERKDADTIAAAMDPTDDTGDPVADSQGTSGEGGTAEPDDSSEAAPRTPEEMFALAESHIEADRPRAARAVLQRLVDEHPDHEKVSEARYRVGQTWFIEGRYQQAILAFQEVLDKHGSSGWAPWSMLRQGQCFEALGQSENAQIFYDDVVRLYPKSKAAKEARSLRRR